MTPTSKNHHLKARDARHQRMIGGKRDSVPRDKISGTGGFAQTGKDPAAAIFYSTNGMASILGPGD